MISWPWNINRASLSEEDKELRDHYLSLFKNKTPGKTPLDELTFIVLDTETSGLDIRKDLILSIAAVKIVNGEISVEDRIECFVHNTNYRPDQSIEIHGITKNRIHTGVDIHTFIRTFISFAGQGIIVGHHIGFDVNMVNKYLRDTLGIRLRNKTLDTAILNHRLEHSVNESLRPVSLDELAHKYGIPLGDRHTAATDTYITAMIFLKLLNRLKKRGVDTYGSLIR